MPSEYSGSSIPMPDVPALLYSGDVDDAIDHAADWLDACLKQNHSRSATAHTVVLKFLTHPRVAPKLYAAVRVSDLEVRPFYTIQSLASRLALHSRTVRRMLDDGEISYYVVKGCRRIDPDDVDRYLANHREEAE